MALRRENGLTRNFISTMRILLGVSKFHPSDIAANWYGGGPDSQGYGQCEACEHRDCDLFYKPFFGYWTGSDISSDVILLGEAPGGNSDGGRTQQNAADEDEKTTSVENDWFTRETKRDLLEVAHPSDNGFSLPQFFVDDLLSKGIESYYTNVKKCNDIHSDYGKETYELARDRCISYLFDEIDAVDPSVVVVFSSETQGVSSSHNIEYCFEQFGLKSHIDGKSKLEIVLPDENDPETLFPAYESDLGFVVIPAYHFTRAGGHLGQRAKFEPAEIGRQTKSYPAKPIWKHRYYDRLSDRIMEFV